MFDWQQLIYFEYYGYVISPAGIVLSLIFVGVLSRYIRKRRKRLKPLQRPNREPYNPKTFRR